jgi:hypothetical protein
MTVHVLDSQGRRQGLPGNKSKIYTVGKYGSPRVAIHPAASLVYRSTDQTSIAGNTWTGVIFDTAKFPHTTYGTPAMWSSGQTVSIIESGWYLLSASIRFDTQGIGGAYVFYTGFRIYTVNGGYQLLSGRMHCPNQYEFPQSGEVVYYLSEGDGVRLHVVHSYTSALNLYGGINNAGLSVARICS